MEGKVNHHVLIVDDNESFLVSQKMNLRQEYKVSTAKSFAEASRVVASGSVDLILLDIDLGGESGLDLIARFRELDESVVVVMLSGARSPKVIVESLQRGACDYLCKPYPVEELKTVIFKNLKNKRVLEKSEALIEHMNQSGHVVNIVGSSRILLDVVETANCLKGKHCNVLIEGESGTGKEVFAKYIHSLERDPKRPFIAINCGAIPENLLESELFGHVKGAFSGADKRQVGKFELADGGDILLDEINSLKLELQVKLLRAIETKEFYPLGSSTSRHVNVRVIATSNENLEEAVARGAFREDLYYRLRVATLKIPSLRGRKEDIEQLAHHFLSKYSNNTMSLSQDAVEALKTYPWKGNVRELKHMMESISILCRSREVGFLNLPDSVKNQTPLGVSIDGLNFDNGLSHKDIEICLKDYVKICEYQFLKQTIERYDGNRTIAAKSLGISRSKMYNILGGNYFKGDEDEITEHDERRAR